MSCVVILDVAKHDEFSTELIELLQPFLQITAALLIFGGRSVDVVHEKETNTSLSRSTKEITFLQAMHEAVDEEMMKDSTVFIMGEGVRNWGALFGEYMGLC